MRIKKILNIIRETKKNNSKLHLFGLLSDGGIHSHINHLFALLELCKKEDLSNVYIHVFLDGRDTLKDVSINYIEQLEQKIEELNIGKIATISGRYYAMDRDSNFDRIKKSYDVITEKTREIKNYKKYIEKSYEKGIYDEFIIPIQVDSNGIVENNDNLIVFNFRPDRLRELFGALTNSEFNNFETKKYQNVKLVSMMPITDEVVYENAFDLPDLNNTLGSYISKKGLKQLRIAETEKYAHVTYFFDGGKELDLKKSKRILIPSPKVATYDLKPSMSAVEITDKLLEEIDKYNLVILNYANGDMVGHTGNLDATIEALETLDNCLERLYNKVMDLKGTLVVTADHGNSDYMLDDDNNVITSHSMSKVPFIITNKKYKLKSGRLSDIAPTLLYILGLKKPKEMTGDNLIEEKKKLRIDWFVLISLILILTLIGTYTYRLIHYYNLEHPKTTESINLLANQIINNEKIVFKDSGLYLNEDEYIYKGEVENNYIYYSGMLFRIMKINSDKSIKVVSDDIVSSLVWNYENNDFEGSYIDKWLNEDVFYKRLINPDKYIVSSSWCIDKIEKDTDVCKKKIERKIGLITYQEYKDALANKSYLNIGKYFFTINGSEDNKVFYIFKEGGVSDESNDGATYYSYGIRPSFTLNNNIQYIRGTGTKEDPYIIEENTEVNVGDYINYSDKLWKIIDTNETYKLMLTDYLKVNDNVLERSFSRTTSNFSLTDYYGLARYLNTNYYNTLDKTYIVDGTFYNGSYTENYNYQNINSSSLTAKVGLPNINETGFSELSDYLIINPASEELIYTKKEDGMLYAAKITDNLKVVPVINISKDIKLVGSGSKEEPFRVGE